MKTTEEMIENFIQLGVFSLKKLYKETLEGRKLNRKEAIILDDGTECRCWREYVVYKMAKMIIDTIPDANVEIELNGNDSIIQVELSDTEQEILNEKMYIFLKKYDAI